MGTNKNNGNNGNNKGTIVDPAIKDPALVPEGTETPDQGNGEPEAVEAPVIVKEGIFTRFGRVVDGAVCFAVNTGKKAWTLAKEHPVVATGVVAGVGYGGYKIYKAVKGEDATDDVIDVEAEVIDLPEIPQIPQVQAPAIPQMDPTPVIPEVVDPVVETVLEGPTEGIFDE